MPLSPLTLTAALMDLDVPAPQSAEAAAEAWFAAWWKYAREMTFWNPATLEASQAAARPGFTALLLPALVPAPLPGVFFLALENAMIGAWALASAVPGTLLPAYAPLPIVPSPALVPGALTTSLLAVGPVGLASPSKEPPRTLMAAIISTWTPPSFVAFTPGSPPVPTPLV